MFKRFKQIIGTKELVKEQVGNYFYYGGCQWGENNELEIIDSKNIETIFYINTYATNSMKLIVESIRGKKEYHLENFPEADDNFLKLEVYDMDSGIKDIQVRINESVAFFQIPEIRKGFYFSRDSKPSENNLGNTNKKDVHTLNIEAIKKIIDRNPFLKNEFGYDIEKMKECLMRPKEIEKYKEYKHNIEQFSGDVGYDIMNDVLINELHYEDFRYLSYSEEELEEFRKLHYKIVHYKSFVEATDEKNWSLKYYLEIV